MTVKQLIKVLSNMREDLKDKEVVVIAENKTCLPVKFPKFLLKDKTDVFNLSKENVEKVLLTWYGL